MEVIIIRICQEFTASESEYVNGLRLKCTNEIMLNGLRKEPIINNIMKVII